MVFLNNAKVGFCIWKPDLTAFPVPALALFGGCVHLENQITDLKAAGWGQD
jgi:hypothetical protein